ncbi:hypothetical protein BDY19DRAFT_990014 [Irpex rosettiformis]|uniref:Uncharacterized protein n=1 Tax=Irpex rosettiformis TaxID=378272 RepID=A0ACB8UH50_9APHY|nr:hypothetical protein BDY19DRAFT_990014 [Irpex rosettiformis]
MSAQQPQLPLSARIVQHSHENVSLPQADNANALPGSLGPFPDVFPPAVTHPSMPVDATGVNPTRKRRGDAEATLAAKHVARKVRLSEKDSISLVAYSKLSEEDQTLTAIALSLKTLAKLNSIQPANTTYTIPELLKGKIEVYVRNAMLCPMTTGYLDDLVRTVMGILRVNPAWGLTREVQDNECHSKVVHDRVSLRATEKRRSIKVMIAQSVGTANRDDPHGHRDNSIDIITLYITN